VSHKLGTLKKIISGGQTGADRAALDFAIDHDIPHGGWCSRAGRLKTVDALMQFPNNPLLVDEAAREFDAVVGKIKAEDFRITAVPEKAICKECDIRSYCASDGVFKSLD
jgi:hypothetical protein